MTTMQPDPFEVMPANQRRVNYGGLMRCCLGTLAECEEPSEPGTVLDCKYETPGNARMVVNPAGVWVWNHP